MEITWTIFIWIISHSMAVHMVSDQDVKRKHTKTDNLLKQLTHYEMVYPVLLDHQGDFLSHDVTHYAIKSRKKRSLKTTQDSFNNFTRERTALLGDKVYYKFSTYGKNVHFNLTLSRHIVSGDFQVEYWNKSGIHKRHHHIDDCHYHGFVNNNHNLSSRVVLSNCHGLHGIFYLDSEQYFVEPLWNHSLSIGTSHPHIVYKESALIYKHSDEKEHHCGVKDSHSHPYPHPHHYHHHHYKHSSSPSPLVTPPLAPGINIKHYHSNKDDTTRKKRSISVERHVETLVVVDKMMIGYHSQQGIETYVLTIMNIVAKLYHDATIGNAINIIVTRLVLLSEDQPNLVLNHHADRSLDSFCKWQKSINPKSDSGSSGADRGVAHHDNAILITRYDICTYKNQPCGTLGLAPVAGMCELDRSCSINEDIGLAAAFTIAHEVGHNFGMQHDGAGNPCGTKGHEPAKIMAAQLTRNTNPFQWSSCSREYITSFLDSGRGHCLNNVPPEKDFEYPRDLPGQLVSSDEQCKLQYGTHSRQCKSGEVCRELWCTSRNDRCVTNSIPAAEGTPCATPVINKGWCYRGECVKHGHSPKKVDGKWGQWSPWGTCSRTCGGGVESSLRSCDSPKPEHGGQYCIGERTRYKSCNIHDCPINSTAFRAVQCTSFNNEPFRGKTYKWLPFTGGQVKACALNCLAEGYNFYTERARKVIDGTRCYPDSLDMCINGECRHVGCDGILGSEAVEDKCRVCGGDGGSCETVSGMFDKKLPKGAYQKVQTLPKGAVHIQITEEKLSRNYLALKSADTDKYYINGAWTIDWPRKFTVAGTVFHYERSTDQPETLRALGPITEALDVMVLLQEQNQGVRYQYNVPVTRNTSNSTIEFIWEYTPWSACTVSCAKGVSKSSPVCLRKDDRTIVDHAYCPRVTKPNDRLRYCNEQPCEPEWIIGDWSACSSSCGGGLRTRSVQCIRKIDQKEEEVLDGAHCTHRRPKAEETCMTNKCPPMWKTDEWSECTPKCGPGHRSRNVYCVSSDGKRRLRDIVCSKQPRPPNRMRCNLGRCPPPSWDTGEWGECSAKCGRGQQQRTVTCKTYTGRPSIRCNARSKPPEIQECQTPCDTEDKTDEECKDVNKVAYCPLVLKFQFCDRAYFRQMCCKTCSGIS